MTTALWCIVFKIERRSRGDAAGLDALTRHAWGRDAVKRRFTARGKSSDVCCPDAVIFEYERSWTSRGRNRSCRRAFKVNCHRWCVQQTICRQIASGAESECFTKFIKARAPTKRYLNSKQIWTSKSHWYTTHAKYITFSGRRHETD